MYYQYRKPTQVGRKRILRRARKPLLRNSASWPRKFAIRGAHVKVSHRKEAQATV